MAGFFYTVPNPCPPVVDVGESMYPRFKNRGIIAPPHPLFSLREVERLKEAIRLLVEELDPLGIYLFGSGAQGLLTPESDLDLAILGSKPYPPEHLFALRAPLSLLVGREVDLIDLRQAPLPLQAQVAAFGEPLYRKSLEADRFLDLALKAYARLNEERAEILGDIQKRGTVYG